MKAEMTCTNCGNTETINLMPVLSAIEHCKAKPTFTFTCHDCGEVVSIAKDNIQNFIDFIYIGRETI